MDSRREKLRENRKEFYKMVVALILTTYAITFFLNGDVYAMAVLFFGLSFMLVRKLHMLLIETKSILDSLIKEDEKEGE